MSEVNCAPILLLNPSTLNRELILPPYFTLVNRLFNPPHCGASDVLAVSDRRKAPVADAHGDTFTCIFHDKC